MRKEKILEILRKPSIEEIVTPALSKTIDMRFSDFTHDYEKTIDYLVRNDLAEYVCGTDDRIESCARAVSAIMGLRKGQIAVISAENPIFPDRPSTHIKKSSVLRIPVKTDAKCEAEAWENTLPLTIRRAVNLIRPGDPIVGMRYDDGRGKAYNIVLRSHIIKGHMIAMIDDDPMIIHGPVCGAGDSGDEKHCYQIKNVVSLSKKTEPYCVNLHQVPTFQKMDAEALSRSLRMSSKHSCEMDDYYSMKGRRYSLSIKPDGTRYESCAYENEKVMCHHIIAAYFAVERYAPRDGIGVVPIFPHPTREERDFFERCRKQVIRERKDGEGRIRRAALREYDIETLLWERIKYLNARRA